MSKKSNLMKGLIIFIFSMFILFTALSGLMYLGVGNNSTGTGDNLTGVVAETGTQLTGEIMTGEIVDLPGSELTGESN